LTLSPEAGTLNKRQKWFVVCILVDARRIVLAGGALTVVGALVRVVVGVVVGAIIVVVLAVGVVVALPVVAVVPLLPGLVFILLLPVVRPWALTLGPKAGALNERQNWFLCRILAVGAVVVVAVVGTVVRDLGAGVLDDHLDVEGVDLNVVIGLDSLLDVGKGVGSHECVLRGQPLLRTVCDAHEDGKGDGVRNRGRQAGLG